MELSQQTTQITTQSDWTAKYHKCWTNVALCDHVSLLPSCSGQSRAGSHVFWRQTKVGFDLPTRVYSILSNPYNIPSHWRVAVALSMLSKRCLHQLIVVRSRTDTNHTARAPKTSSLKSVLTSASLSFGEHDKDFAVTITCQMHVTYSGCFHHPGAHFYEAEDAPNVCTKQRRSSSDCSDFAAGVQETKHCSSGWVPQTRGRAWVRPTRRGPEAVGRTSPASDLHTQPEETRFFLSGWFVQVFFCVFFGSFWTCF